MDLDSNSDDENIPKVRVKFITKVSTLRVADIPIAVPETLSRYGLSEVINHLLGLSGDDAARNGKAPIPFDILINGRFLRTSLLRYMKSNAIGGENVLELEYTPALRQPTESGSDSQPDWVSAISCSNFGNNERNIIATTSYDGCIRLYDDEIKVLNCVKASRQPLTALAVNFMPSTEESCILAGGKDKSVTFWNVVYGDDEQLEQRAVLHGHEESVTSISMVSGKSEFHAASGDWDGRICLWNLTSMNSLSNDENVASKNGTGDSIKRKKLSEGNSSSTLLELKPVASFKAHSQAVSGTNFAHDANLFTSSYDRSVKMWDAQCQDCVHTTSTMKAVTCMDVQKNSEQGLVATGHPDQHIRIFDFRTQKGATLTLANLASKGGWIYGVKWSEESTNHIVSSSRDGTVRIWDMRSGVPLHSLAAHTKSALCVTWQNGGVLSGGEDGIVRSYKIPSSNS